MLPLFQETFSEMEELVEEANIFRNPYEYKKLKNYYSNGKKEVRMGCVLCPYKDGDYYLFLKKHYELRYLYCNLLRVIASAKNIIRSGREYYYYNEEFTPKSHPEWKFIM